MKKIQHIIRIAFVSWGLFILFLFPWLGGKYSMIQSDLSIVLKGYLGIVAVYVLFSLVFGLKKNRNKKTK